MAIYNPFTHKKWWCSMVMLVYQGVTILYVTGRLTFNRQVGCVIQQTKNEPGGPSDFLGHVQTWWLQVLLKSQLPVSSKHLTYFSVTIPNAIWQGSKQFQQYPNRKSKSNDNKNNNNNNHNNHNHNRNHHNIYEYTCIHVYKQYLFNTKAIQCEASQL